MPPSTVELGLPVIDLSYSGDVDPKVLAAFVERHHLSGAVIKRRTVPSKEWWTALTQAFEEKPASVLVLQTEAALWNTPRAGEESKGEWVIRPEVGDRMMPEPGEGVELRELPIGSVLIPPLRATWRVPVQGPEYELAEEEAAEAADLDFSTPRLYLMGVDGQLSLLPPP